MKVLVQVGTALAVVVLAAAGAAAATTKYGSEAGWDIYVEFGHGSRLPDYKGSPQR